MTSQSLKSFREFEHSGWQMAADAYHRFFGALTVQTIGPLADRLEPLDSKEVLDLACGPGYVAHECRRRGAIVCGVDFCPAMVEKAGRLYPDCRFIEADAEQLQFEDGSFDAVAMNFGILHLDQPEKAIKEVFRVLRRGGRFAFTVWALPEQAQAFGIVLSAIESFGDQNVTLPPGPPFFLYSDPQNSREQLNKAGFTSIETQMIALRWRLESPHDLLEAFIQGTARTGGLLRAQSPEALAKIRQAVHDRAVAYLKDNHLEIPMAALLASASRA